MCVYHETNLDFCGFFSFSISLKKWRQSNGSKQTNRNKAKCRADAIRLVPWLECHLASQTAAPLQEGMRFSGSAEWLQLRDEEREVHCFLRPCSPTFLPGMLSIAGIFLVQPSSQEGYKLRREACRSLAVQHVCHSFDKMCWVWCLYMQSIKHWWSSISFHFPLGFFFFFSNETVLMASFCFQSLETFLWIYFFNFFFLFSNKKHILILYRLAMRYGRVGAALKTSFPAGLNEPERLCLCACGGACAWEGMCEVWAESQLRDRNPAAILVSSVTSQPE